jgi:hypothetical protein
VRDRWPEAIGFHVWRVSPIDMVMGWGERPSVFMCQRCGKFKEEPQPSAPHIDYPDPAGCEYRPSEEVFA